MHRNLMRNCFEGQLVIAGFQARHSDEAVFDAKIGEAVGHVTAAQFEERQFGPLRRGRTAHIGQIERLAGDALKNGRIGRGIAHQCPLVQLPVGRKGSEPVDIREGAERGATLAVRLKRHVDRVPEITVFQFELEKASALGLAAFSEEFEEVSVGVSGQKDTFGVLRFVDPVDGDVSARGKVDRFGAGEWFYFGLQGQGHVIQAFRHTEFVHG